MLLCALVAAGISTAACQSSSSSEPNPRATMKGAIEDRSMASYSDKKTAAQPQLPPVDAKMLEQFTRQESQFKEHYERYYAGSGYAYSQYRPAYQYGFELAADNRYKSLDWPMIELQAHRGWDEASMGQWDRYKDAVRFGWERGIIAQRG
jgi:hypothetical protein